MTIDPLVAIKILSSALDAFGKRIRRRRTPLIEVSTIQVEPGRSSHWIVARPTKEILRKRRRPTQYLIAIVLDDAPVWGSRADAKVYDRISSAVDDIHRIVAAGHGRLR